MIELISRDECFALSPFLCCEVLARQQELRSGFFSGDESEEQRLAGEEWLARSCDPTAVEQRARAVSSALYELSCPDIERFAGLLAAATCTLFRRLGLDRLCCIPGLRVPWLVCQNTHPPLVESRRRLLQWIGDESFDGGLVTDQLSAAEVLPVLFWLSRCATETPHVFFAGPQHAAVFAICQHGGLHAQLYDEQQAASVSSCATLSGFQQVEQCSDQLSDSRGVEGKQERVS